MARVLTAHPAPTSVGGSSSPPARNIRPRWLSRDYYRELWRLQQSFEYRAFIVVAYLQVLVAVAIASLPWILGTAKRFTVSTLLVYVGVVIWVDALVKKRIDALGGNHRSRFLSALMNAGVVLLALIPFLVGWALWLRGDAGRSRLMPAVVLGILVLGALFWRAGQAALRTGRAPWVSFGMALILGPLLLGWAAGSGVWHASTRLGSGESSYDRYTKRSDAAMAAPRAEAGVACPDAFPPAYSTRRINIALALSGGGYRAAAAHAGLLDALDEACIRVDYLTTVSGGSIVGAYYALGLSPRDFARDLYAGKPGLANDQLLPTSLLAEWFSPRTNSADTYAAHFKRVFFGDATLAHLKGEKERPVLIVNATAVEEERESVREVFFKGRAPGIDATTRVADVVAASAAFPGAFAPKRLLWPVAEEAVETASARTPRPFIDGGVVDNLGVEGLRRYLMLPREGKAPPRPDVLVISDTSLYAGRAAFGSKPELVSVLMRAEELAWTALHRHVYARFTGKENYLDEIVAIAPEKQVARVRYGRQSGERGWTGLVPGHPDTAPERLHTVVVPVTAPTTARLLDRFHGSCALNDREPGPAVQRTVAAYRTLDELVPGQVVRAYWLGYVLGKVYAPAIECAWTMAADPQHKCPERPDRDSLLQCPSQEQVETWLERRTGGTGRPPRDVALRADLSR